LVLQPIENARIFRFPVQLASWSIGPSYKKNLSLQNFQKQKVREENNVP